MAQVSYDSRSFLVDGRRVWVFGVTLDPSTIPSPSWPDRIHAARLLGASVVTVPVVWGRVEPRPDRFDFGGIDISGRSDLRNFLRLVHDAGLYAILRPGPFVGPPWDMGGMPSWLLDVPEMSLRTANRPFLEACGRYLTSLAREVRDLQVTGAGPIIAVQNEHNWACGDEDLAEGYLGELSRYLRESGFAVPTLSTNNLWAGVEGEIDCWSGEHEMLGLLRELATVRPEQPRIVTQFGNPSPAVMGRAAPSSPDPEDLLNRIAQAVAACGQVNLEPFAGGLVTGFWGGRDPDAGLATSGAEPSPHALVDGLGVPTPAYHAVRRIGVFTQHFGRVLASAEPDYRPVVADPTPRDGSVRAPTIAHLRGGQGSVVFVFAPASVEAPGVVPIMLPDGQSLSVPVGRSGVAWVLLDTSLRGRTVLNHATLSVLSYTGRLLVLFGPAGSVGVVSINGTPLELVVPETDEPVVVDHEGCILVVVNDDAVDRTYPTDKRVYVGVSRVTADQRPVPIPGLDSWRIGVREDIEAETTVYRARVDHTPGAPAPEAAARPSLGSWAIAPSADHTDGTSPRYASIDGPMPSDRLGAPFGYGWYRIGFRAGAAKKIRLAAPGGGDRLHVFLDAEPVGVLGHGPGASPELSVSIKRGGRTLVALADNLGRASGGGSMGERKGLTDHLYEVAALRVGKAKLVDGPPVDLLGWRRPLDRVRRGDLTWPSRVTWSFRHLKNTPLFVSIPAPSRRGILMLNDTPLRFVEEGTPTLLVLDNEATARGTNTLQFAIVDDLHDEDAAGAVLAEVLESLADVAFREGVAQVTGKGAWAFAKWEPPARGAFRDVSKAEAASATDAGVPAWWRGELTVPDPEVPIRLALSGMTKGQVYLNGVDLGRYFVATGDGTSVPPHGGISLPAAHLRAGANEVMLFDEHGGNPAKIRIEAGDPASVIRAGRVDDE